MSADSKWVRLLKEPRIIFTILIILGAIAAIGPRAYPGDSGVMELKTNIVKGLDLQGGVRALVLPDEPTKPIVDEAITVLNTRLSAFGLQETKLRPINIEGDWYIEIELAGSTEEELTGLLEKQGKFEAYIPRTTTLDDNTGELIIDGKTHTIEFVNENTAKNRQLYFLAK